MTMTTIQTTEKSLGIEEARDLLLRAVAAQGRGFVYNEAGQGASCLYVPATEENVAKITAGGAGTFTKDDPRRTTGCLIGTALTLRGETRHLYAVATIDNVNIDFLDGMITTEAEKYLLAAQNSQDKGSTWGEAFDKAEESLRV